MRVLVAGATGFIDSHLVPELINAGHRVLGLTRSDAGSDALTLAGAEVFRGDMNDFDRLRTVAEAVDGIIYAAVNHDFSNLKQHSENDRKVIMALGDMLAGESAARCRFRHGPRPVENGRSGGQRRTATLDTVECVKH
jgi:nucleoside-diphosphate-sugar epimerase